LNGFETALITFVAQDHKRAIPPHWPKDLMSGDRGNYFRSSNMRESYRRFRSHSRPAMASEPNPIVLGSGT
jgi:hypothetical protein